jgi:glutamate dehydrogenase (NAD(P)+)
VIGSCFEQVQNAYNFYWSAGLVDQRLDQKISTAFDEMHQVAERQGIPHQLAAYLIAVARVAEACQLRGWV